MIYTIKQFPDKKFTDKMDQTRFIKSHQDALVALKLAEFKKNASAIIRADLIAKNYSPLIEDITSDVIEVKAIINTTNVIDSHLDLHMPKIWNKTVADNPYTHHLKEHQNRFENVISKRARSFNETMNFKDLGLTVDKQMTANINQFTLERKRMPYMFDQYKDGQVDQHSVGMMYVSLDLAYYDEESEKQMAYFENMKKEAINPEVADEYGFFWVINEAKKKEGSAVVFGSNSITPTLFVKNYEPSSNKNDTHDIDPKEAAQKALQDKRKFFINL